MGRGPCRRRARARAQGAQSRGRAQFADLFAVDRAPPGGDHAWNSVRGDVHRRRAVEMAENSALTGRQLLAEVRDVVYDLPLFVTSPLYRSWHCRCGATPAEVADTLPGDALLPHAQFRSTRAITINAPPGAVWPWLVQVGCGRAGFYSNDLLDNLGP